MPRTRLKNQKKSDESPTEQVESKKVGTNHNNNNEILISPNNENNSKNNNNNNSKKQTQNGSDKHHTELNTEDLSELDHDEFLDDVSESESFDDQTDSSFEGEPNPKSSKNATSKVATGVEAMPHTKFHQLTQLLEKACMYSDFMSVNLNEVELAKKKKKKAKSERSQNNEDNNNNNNHSLEAIASLAEASDSTPAIEQPKLITGGVMKKYQLQGAHWLIALWRNGVNGILADEMGLGKTIQTISLFAHLVEKGVKGPFLVVAPLSTITNWMNEIKKWAPSLSALLYYGAKDKRADLQYQFSKKTIIVTSYDMVLQDKKNFNRVHWKYLVVDEGQRIKNMNCRLIKELKSLTSSNRLLLSGTPIQNSLSELWSMLNFLMPDIFNDLDQFEEWFDFSDLNNEGKKHEIVVQEQTNQIITKLHKILRPFILRRLKVNVDLNLPLKREKIIYTELTQEQQKLYSAILKGDLYKCLSEKSLKQLQQRGVGLTMKLMQLRKACNHPYLFEWPVNENEEEIIDEKIVSASGKFQVLDRLLKRFHAEKTLNVIQDYLHLRQYAFHRIDGSTPHERTSESDERRTRQEQMDEFNTSTDINTAFCFLLSTRAGGLGINLTAAHIVIFFDSDWNPQMDFQAMDRCHRIGQKRPVQVYRLITANSVEGKILEKARSKTKLEALVIKNGNFISPQSKSSLYSHEVIKQLLDEKNPENVGIVSENQLDDKHLFDWTVEFNTNEDYRATSLLDG